MEDSNRVSLEFLLFKSGDYVRSPAPHFHTFACVSSSSAASRVASFTVSVVDGILLHVLTSETVYGVIVAVYKPTF